MRASAIRLLLDDINNPYNEEELLYDFAQRADWMADVQDSARLSQLSIPGTHDSGAWEAITARAVSYLGGSDRHGNNIARIWTTLGGLPLGIAGALTAGLGSQSLFTAYTATQTWNITQQLNGGIRFLDIRCRHQEGQCNVVHNIIDLQQTLDDVLTEVQDFLTAHPTEAVLVKIKAPEDNFLGEHLEGDSDFNSTFVSKYLPAYSSVLWPSTTSCSVDRNNPTLGEIRGKAVIIQQFSDIGGSGNCHGIPFSAFTASGWFQDELEVQWGNVKAGLEAATIDIFPDTLHFIGLNGNRLSELGESPDDFAKYINPRTHDWLDSFKGRVGIVSMDFPGPSLIFRIIMQNRRVAKRPCANDKPVCAELATFKVHVKTQDTANAGTDADVYAQLTTAGPPRQFTGKHLLDTKDYDNLERDSLDTFWFRDWDLTGRDDTQLVLTRPAHGPASDWAVEWVQVTSDRTGLTTRFDVDTVLESVGSRDIHAKAATFPASETISSLANYTVTVRTADESLAGTDGDVYVILNGAKGESRKLKLDDGGNNFEAGDVDTFEFLDVRDVGSIDKITIGQDGGGGWKLSTVEVVAKTQQDDETMLTNGPKEGLVEVTLPMQDDTTVFTFNGWVDGDGKVDVYSAAASATYTVVVETTDRFQAGTNGDVRLQLVNAAGETTATHLLDNDGDDFEAGDRGTYTFTDRDIGLPTQARVSLDGGTGWLLHSVSVQSDKASGTAWFIGDRWIYSDSGDVELNSAPPQQRYRVDIYTADVGGAGTDGDVWIYLHGSLGSGKRHILDKANYDDFERDDLDSYFFTDDNLGTVTGVLIGQDGGGGWDLGYIRVYSDSTSGSDQLLKTLNINKEIGGGGCVGAGSPAPGSSFSSRCARV